MRRRLLIPTIFFVFLGIVTLLLGEIAVRALVWLDTPYGTIRFRQYDPELGLSLVPAASGQHARGCFKGEISINEWGMRDRARTIDKPNDVFRIALLGDSIIEGAHVAPAEVANIVLENALAAEDKRVEVMNFGLASIGTTQQYLLYKRDVKRFAPDLVVLLFYPNNDVMNNSSVLQPRTYGKQTWYAPYFDVNANGELDFTPVQTRDVSWIREWVESHSRLIHYLYRLYDGFTRTNTQWHSLSLPYGAYGTPPDDEWRDAWTVTDRVIQKLRDEVVADGAGFAVMVLPVFYDMDPDWQKTLAARGPLPESFKPVEVVQAFKERLSSQNIAHDDLGPHFARYRADKELKPPYFSFPCDSHLTALGHDVLANAMRESMERLDVLPDE